MTMTDQSQTSAPNATTTAAAARLKSAFRLTYLLIFVAATASVPLVLLPKGFEAAKKAGHGILDTNGVASLILLGFFILGVCLHAVRVYLTFEMLEDRHELFGPVVDDIKEGNRYVRFAEFAVRWAIILIVTYKAYSHSTITEFEHISLYLFFLYLALFAWSMVIICFVGRPFLESYFIVA